MNEEMKVEQQVGRTVEQKEKKLEHGVGVSKPGQEHERGPEPRREERRERRRMEDNVIYIGKKGVMNYVMAAITQMNKGEKEIHIKARGRSISKAVDVVQLLKNRFETATQVKRIDIGTEEVEADEGGKINVSTIDLVIGK